MKNPNWSLGNKSESRFSNASTHMLIFWKWIIKYEGEFNSLTVWWALWCPQRAMQLVSQRHFCIQDAHEDNASIEENADHNVVNVTTLLAHKFRNWTDSWSLMWRKMELLFMVETENVNVPRSALEELTLRLHLCQHCTEQTWLPQDCQCHQALCGWWLVLLWWHADGLPC